MKGESKDLNVALVRQQFAQMIAEAKRNRDLSDWESGFVRDMEHKFHNRDDTVLVTGYPWNPSIKQWNQLWMLANPT